MLKLAGGHTHLQSPAGIATTTPHRTEAVAAPVHDTPQGSGNSAFDQEPQPSQECSEGPQNSWSNISKMQADKRRRLNRESAQRTRKRKQEQTQQLETKVANLKCENLFKGERIKSLTSQLEGLTTENKNLQLDKQMLMKCMGEITAVCKSKEAALAQLQDHVRHAGSIKDVALPLAEQVENQLSPDSLQFWHSQKSQQGLSLSLAAHRPHSMPPPEVGHIQKHEGRQSSLSHANIMRHPPQASLTPTPANTPRFTSRPVSQQPQPRCNVLSNEHGLQQGAYNNSISIGNTHKELPTLAASEGPVVQLGSYNFSCPDNPQTVSSSAPPPEAVLQQSNYNNSTSPGNTGTAHSGLIPSGRPALRQGFYNNSIFPGNAHSSPLSLTLGDLDHSLPQGHMLSMPSLTAAASIFSKHSAQLQQDLTHQGNRIMAVHAATLQHRLNAGQSMTKATPAYQPLVDMAPNVPSPAACMGDMLSRALNWKQSQHLSQANLSLMQTSSLQADAAPEPDYLQEMYDATNLTVQQAPMQQASGYATNTLADQPGLAYPAADPNACSLYDTAFS